MRPIYFSCARYIAGLKRGRFNVHYICLVLERPRSKDINIGADPFLVRESGGKNVGGFDLWFYPIC